MTEVTQATFNDQPVPGVVIYDKDTVHSIPSGDDSMVREAEPPATVTRSRWRGVPLKMRK